MAEETFDPAIHPPRIYTIPEQLIQSGKAVKLNLGDFTEVAEGEKIHFSISDIPEELSLDSNTGILTGQAPQTELNKTYFATFIATNVETGRFSQALFRLEIVGFLLLETTEGQAFFAKQELNFWDACQTWELQLFIQQLIVEHYAWVMMYDDSKQQDQLGALINSSEASTGWLILEFENAVMVTPGNKTYEQYGNRRRILDTLREAQLQVVEAKGWDNIAIVGSDTESIGKCWVIAKELNLPVDIMAPSDVAEINYYNIKRVFAEDTPSKPKPKPTAN